MYFPDKEFEKEHEEDRRRAEKELSCRCMVCLDMMPRHFKTSRIAVCEGCAAYLDYFDFENENVGEWFLKADKALRRTGKTLEDLHSPGVGREIEGWDSTILMLCRAVDLKLLSASGKQYRPENWTELSWKIKQMDGNKCAICGIASSVMHVHHIVPLSSEGTNHPNNLIVLCPECHQKQHKHDILSSCNHR